jgi:uncharacterized NAD(P)/FAD-binding protein YdhS
LQRCIAIIGAGFSGAVTAANLLRLQGGSPPKVVLIDRSDHFARGLAYGVWDDNLVLNVPAGNMSALSSDSGHFLAYCQRIDPHFNSGSFLPRRIYGDYLEDTLSEAEQGANARVERVRGAVYSVRPNSGAPGFTIELADGRELAADQVVLALGNHAPRTPKPFQGLCDPDGYLGDPWNLVELDRSRHRGVVMLLGTGHTAIDTLFRLQSQGNVEKVLLLSRRGLLPHAHRLLPKAPEPVPLLSYLDGLDKHGVRAYTRAIRLELGARRRTGGDWRDVLNELRAHVPRIWQGLDYAERRRFLEHLLPFWDVHRHRLAPSAHQRLSRLLASGQAEVVAGRVLACEPSVAGLGLRVRERGSRNERTLRVQGVVNCTGPSYDLSQTSSSLIRQLRQEGLMVEDEFRLGLKIDSRYQLLGREGRAVPGLHYVGPMLKAQFWEATAVPELRVHSAHLAEILLATALP